MLTINLEWDPNAQRAPQSFRDAVQAAANALDAAIDDPITVNVAVGYGEYDDGGPEFTPLTQFSLGGVNAEVPVSYSLLRAALANDETSPTDVQAINTLPDTHASISADGTPSLPGLRPTLISRMHSIRLIRK